jgi:hypothetical protein
LGGCGDGEEDMNWWVIGFMVAVILALVSIDSKVEDLVKKQSVSDFALYTFDDKSGMWYRLRLEDLRVLEINKEIVPPEFIGEKP